MARSVNAAQQEDSGIFWGSVKAVDVFRGFEMFVLEAFDDNRVINIFIRGLSHLPTPLPPPPGLLPQ
ncbi:hypothetical protein NQZ68_007619 [Dissostichus eleginoides]|nr:hypothetical protein NQZ68_007619 [Dissostichus eleginoides]